MQTNKEKHGASNIGDMRMSYRSSTKDGFAMLQQESLSSKEFSGVLIFRCPNALAAAISQAAHRELLSKSAYVRRAILAAVRRDGFLDCRQEASKVV
jgi:predicted HicB family RNase H-like nuclease